MLNGSGGHGWGAFAVERDPSRSRELQVQVDDVTACAGLCPGCILTSVERRATSVAMPEAVLSTVRERLLEYVSGLAPLGRVNVTWGAGDHLTAPAGTIPRLHRIGAEIVRAARPTDARNSAVFFTTSLVGRPRDVVAKLRAAVDEGASDVPLVPVVVMDPRLLLAAKFGPAYRDMILETRDLFPRANLSINLSDDAVRQMGPDDLVAFAVANGFTEVVANWMPTEANVRQTAGDLDALEAWLLGFDDEVRRRPEIESSFHPVIHGAVAAARGLPGGGLVEALRDVVPETVAKSFVIDPNGVVVPKFEAVGDALHGHRTGLPDLGNVADAPIADLLARGMSRVQRAVGRAHASSACMSCPYQAACAVTGFHVANRVLAGAGLARAQGCPHVARALFDRVAGAQAAEAA